jgi:hypothetical protein
LAHGCTGEHLSFDLARRGYIEVGAARGKTEELLRRIKRARLARLRVQLFKPRVDQPTTP